MLSFDKELNNSTKILKITDLITKIYQILSLKWAFSSIFVLFPGFCHISASFFKYLIQIY